MIDKQAFKAGLAVLAGAFSRDLDEAVILTYYRVLNPRLSTDEFQRAVQIVLETETFWPPPATIVNAIHPPNAGQLALKAVFDAMRPFGGHLHFPHSEFQKFSPAQKAGIKAAGGLGALSTASEKRQPYLERQFVEGYESVADPAKALAEPKDENPVRRIGKRSQPTEIARLIPTTVFGDRT